VQDLVSGEIGYGSIMGASGNLFGLAVYIGDDRTQNAATRTALQPLTQKLGVTLLKVCALPIIGALREEMPRCFGV